MRCPYRQWPSRSPFLISEIRYLRPLGRNLGLTLAELTSRIPEMNYWRSSEVEQEQKRRRKEEGFKYRNKVISRV